MRLSSLLRHLRRASGGRAVGLEVRRTPGAGELGDFRATSLSTPTQMVASGVAVTLLAETLRAVR